MLPHSNDALRSLLAAVNTAAGAGLPDLHFAEQGQVGFEPGPDPAGDILAGGVVQAGNVVEVVVVQLFEHGFECGLEFGKVHHPAGRLRRLAAHRQPDLERVAVQASALVFRRDVGQPVGGLEVKFLVDFHGCALVVGSIRQRLILPPLRLLTRCRELRFYY